MVKTFKDIYVVIVAMFLALIMCFIGCTKQTTNLNPIPEKVIVHDTIYSEKIIQSECPECGQYEEKIIEDNLYFEFGQSNLTKATQIQLDVLFNTPNEDNILKAYVECSACTQGPEEYNKYLSQERCRTVSDYINFYGVPTRTKPLGSTGEGYKHRKCRLLITRRFLK